jgi:prepilin-type N-terminal cleavage/methylation domain-containing protein
MLNENKSRELSAKEQAFTLIELSIVLVIIGLIVGGVLVGQDLIRAAEVRATISQIEKYNTAVNTFRTKYNSLPGDLNAATATAFGFASRSASGTAGEGDGNGVIEGIGPVGFYQIGETLSFWVDLSVGNPGTPMNVNLIDGSFSSYTSPTVTSASVVASAISAYFPAAKLGRGNSVYVYSTGGTNFFGITNISSTSAAGAASVKDSMTVAQAYQIDKKVDDGYPVTGNVTANRTDSTLTTDNVAAYSAGSAPTGSDSATSCYNTSTTAGVYSVAYNNGSTPNCSLSFRFQ